MLNWLLRYEPFLEVLDTAPSPRVLDVGSGWYGLSWYWPHQVVQTDLQMQGAAPHGDRRGQAHYVCASAERLPFADASFDFVLSSDLMEHLPVALRAASVGELTRVARTAVLLGFPQGRAASWVDRAYASFLRLLWRPVPDWLEEHLLQDAYPSREDVEAGLPADWCISQTRRNGNVIVQFLVVVGETLPVVRGLLHRVERALVGRRLPGWLHLPPTVRVLYVLRPRGT